MDSHEPPGLATGLGAGPTTGAPAQRLVAPQAAQVVRKAIKIKLRTKDGAATGAAQPQMTELGVLAPVSQAGNEQLLRASSLAAEARFAATGLLPNGSQRHGNGALSAMGASTKNAKGKWPFKLGSLFGRVVCTWVALATANVNKTLS